MRSVLHLILPLIALTTAPAFTPRRRSVLKAGSCDRISHPSLCIRPLTALLSEDEGVTKSMQNQTSGIKAAKALTLAKTSNNVTSVLALQQQAAALRAEIALIESDLRASEEAKRNKEIADIDRWIEECLYVSVKTTTTTDDNDDDTTSTTATRIELLNSVETAAQVLRDNRYSHEQVSKMFDRICDTSPAQSRSNCSPLLALLVDAAGKLDCVDREKNPNKRWDGRVERDLRKRLFAMDWGIHLEPELDNNDRFV